MSEDLNYFATSLVSSITAFSLYKVISTQCRIGERQKQIDELKNLKIKSADDAFVLGQRTIIKGNVARNSKDSRNDVIVRQQSSGKKQEYVAYVKFKQAIYSNENFSNKEQYVINFKDLLGKADILVNPSFLLKGLRNSITISNFDNADYSRMLDITKWENRRRRLIFTQKIEVLMLSYLRALGTLVVTDRGRPSFLRGIDVGTREVETGLKVGASILALGTIGISLDGQIFLQPHLLFKDRLSMIANIQDILEDEETTRNIWLIALLAGCIYVGRRIYKYQKKNDIITDIKNWWRGQNKPNKQITKR